MSLRALAKIPIANNDDAVSQFFLGTGGFWLGLLSRTVNSAVRTAYGGIEMKRSMIPIVTIILALATTIVSVAPANACWWGRDRGWSDHP
jgi:hypothetical protein